MELWKLKQHDFSVETAQAYEGLFTLGSGYLHTRGSMEEHFADCPQNSRELRKPANVTAEKFVPTPSKWGTYVPGIFGNHPLLLQEMINLPCFLGMAPVIEGERLDLAKSHIADFYRELNMKTASIVRSLVWKLPSGLTVNVRFERFISGARKQLALQRMTLTADQPFKVTVHAGIDADVTTNGFDHFTSVEFRQTNADALACAVTTDVGDVVTMQSKLTADHGGWEYRQDGREADLTATFTVSAKVPLVIEKRTAVSTSRDLEPLPADECLASAAGLAWDDLFSEHCSHWQQAWARTDIAIEGDDDAQLIIRSSIYHLLRAHVPGDSRVAVGAKGHAGEAYKGHFFWDTEVYLLPFYLYTDPEKAKTLIDFRVSTLPEAEKLAESFGYQGARYPWEADADGRECCSGFQYSDHEIHVTADVVYGIAHFFRALPRADVNASVARVYVQTARYWLDRINWREGDDYPSILGVMGPDEYAPVTHNNSYTNRMVAFNLERAAQHGHLAGVSKEECQQFADVAAKLPIIRSSADPELVLQCENFDKLAEPEFDRFWSDRKGCYAARVSQERLYRSKNLKQADVILLMELFPHEFPLEEVAKAWDYYVPVTTHDSSLSAGIHAMTALRLGKDREAWDFFMKSAGIDIDVDHGGAAQGIHIAGCACNWQVLLFGYAGMRTAMQSEILTFSPKLPQGWEQMRFPITWKDVPINVTITPDACEITNNGDRALEVNIWSQTASIAPKTTKEFKA